MLKGWVIYSRDTLSSKFGDNAFDWMVDAAAKYDLDVEILFEEDFDLMTTADEHLFFCNGEAIEKPHFTLMRSYGLDLAMHLEQAKIPVFNNPQSMEWSQDKWKTHQILSGFKLPSPESFVSKRQLCYDELRDILGSNFVMKGLLGSKGEDVYLVRDENTLKKAELSLSGQKVMYQKFVAESSGTDIRVHVIGGEVVAAVRRRSVGDFKSNFHQGGSAETVELTKAMRSLSLQAAKALDLDFAGIDLLEGGNGPTICEVNAIPGFRTICLTSDADIPSLIFKHIRARLDV